MHRFRHLAAVNPVAVNLVFPVCQVFPACRVVPVVHRVPAVDRVGAHRPASVHRPAHLAALKAVQLLAVVLLAAANRVFQAVVNRVPVVNQFLPARHRRHHRNRPAVLQVFQVLVVNQLVLLVRPVRGLVVLLAASVASHLFRVQANHRLVVIRAVVNQVLAVRLVGPRRVSPVLVNPVLVVRVRQFPANQAVRSVDPRQVNLVPVNLVPVNRAAYPVLVLQAVRSAGRFQAAVNPVNPAAANQVLLRLVHRVNPVVQAVSVRLVQFLVNPAAVFQAVVLQVVVNRCPANRVHLVLP